MTSITIAVDAMGGDFGPSVTVPAAILVLKKYPDLILQLVGKTDAIKPYLDQIADLQSRMQIVDAAEVVAMDDLPSFALRKKKNSSMRIAINQVKDGQAQASVSAGNTGALMATARFVLKTLPGIDRPAIVTSFPTLNDKGVNVLDLGANVDSGPENLYQFAVMGSILTSAINNIEQPKVALLNIGAEQIKGNEQVKEAAHLLQDSRLVNFVGYVEGDEIFAGHVDVIVCDGFVGNIALKTIEGTSNAVSSFVKRGFNKNIFTKLLGLISKPVFASIKKSINPDHYNGATLLGLNGIVVKSHGNAEISAFAKAIETAIKEVENNVPEQIRQKIAVLLQENQAV